MTKQEEVCGLVAAALVEDCGGFVTFDEYDRLMSSTVLRTDRGYERNTRYVYFAPLSWADGWGDPVLHKQNCDKLCAFAAVKMGLLEQTAHGYRVLDSR